MTNTAWSDKNLLRKAFAPSIGEQLDALGLDWSASSATGRLLYTVNGEALTPGQVSARYL